MREIRTAIDQASCDLPHIVPVVPCKMSEAWLLIDPDAIRMAAGNPNGKILLKLPPTNKLEKIADPKNTSITLLKEATELNNRRLKKFNPRLAIHRLSETIEDYSLLRNLEAFQKLEEELDKITLDF